ncbi:hypothetical protein DFP72DRAFT_989989 [Ephemerocybe angulata]|uniref:Uncharacterized protein n=1 Tax=Ephemerocybe angulata TaxID=980116 RepID=A0A8H6M5W4_9AGAR|nr:hypothetical protein DFP72DRAFT_989989 [Tulosesus angulatus]
MSTTSLPAYVATSDNRAPTYSYEPAAHEQRFVKQSKSGHISLRLTGQEEDVTVPVYVSNSIVEGSVELSRTEGITRIELKIEGNLKIREIGEGGHSTVKLCLENQVLWSKGQDAPSPSMLAFSFRLPESFTFEDKTYPLPPTHGVKLSGFPGFTANIDYSVSVLINKPNTRAISSKAMGLIVGTTAVNTPFLYRPRTRPPSAVPPPLITNASGFALAPEWTLLESVLPSRQPGLQDIATKLYIPSNRTFYMRETTYLPLSPTAKTLNSRKSTQVQLMRQSTVDVRNIEKDGLKQDMWRVDCIGEGTIKLTADAPLWIAYNGEIKVDPEVAIAGFKAAGLSVKDCILFTVTPPEPAKCPFGDLRQVASVKLTTDPWNSNGAGVGRPPSGHSSE